MNKVYNLICSAGTATATMTDDGVIYTAQDKENNIVQSKSIAVTEAIKYKGIDSVTINAGMVKRSGIEILIGLLAFGLTVAGIICFCTGLSEGMDGDCFLAAACTGIPGIILSLLEFKILGMCKPHTGYTVDITYSGFNRTLSFLTEADMQEFYSELIRKVG